MNHTSKENGVASERLMQLKIDLNSIKCDNYKPDTTCWKFNKITCEKLVSGNKRMIFTKHPSTENDLKTIVEELSKVLGIDSANRNGFQNYELIIYQNNINPELPIRYWMDYTDFNIELKGNSGKESIILCVESKIYI